MHCQRFDRKKCGYSWFGGEFHAKLALKNSTLGAFWCLVLPASPLFSNQLILDPRNDDICEWNYQYFCINFVILMHFSIFSSLITYKKFGLSRKFPQNKENMKNTCDPFTLCLSYKPGKAFSSLILTVFDSQVTNFFQNPLI